MKNRRRPAPATKLQLTALRAIWRHEQTTGEGITKTELSGVMGDQSASGIRALAEKGWIEHEGDHRWYLTYEGVDELEKHPEESEEPAPRPLTNLQAAVLRAIDDYWREHGRAPSRWGLRGSLGHWKSSITYAAESLAARGLVTKETVSQGRRETCRLHLTDAGREELERLTQSQEAAE